MRAPSSDPARRVAVARLVVASFGALVYAAAGAAIGAMNAGWFGLERNANAMLPILGVGAGLVVLAFRSSRLADRLSRVGALGRAAKVLLVAGPVLYVLAWVVQFAILGTLTLGIGLVCLTVAVWRGRLTPVPDRILIALSAIGSLTWNTETLSAFLLVGVGLLWLVLAVRLLAGTTDGPY